MTRVAVEVGGTFTDLIWIAADGAVHTNKIPSTPADPSRSVISGLNAAMSAGPADSMHVIHGSTVATNAVIERKGCRAALITTRGFRDLLVLQRQLRPNVYATYCEKPIPLVPLERTLEARGRLSAAGDEIAPVDMTELGESLRAFLKRESPEAIGVCLMHSYRNPKHEQQVREAIHAIAPSIPVILSSEILPTFREYERASTTAMATYLAPLVGQYLSKLEQHLNEHIANGVLFVMQSSGGVLPSGGARNRSVDMLNSGPAAGVIAATRVAQRVGDPRLITLDIGGTSADVCLVRDGRPEMTAETEVAGLPVGRPTLDIANVGAGGGSIGWIDDGGMLQVGPRSAGARPGPACYGHGGTEPTLTDALLSLGWLRAETFLGGRMPLHRGAGEAALSELAGKLRQTVNVTAQSIVDIAVANVSRCVRLVSVQRGYDPAQYALYAYGGMGPMIAALSAQELRINRVVVPPYSGLFSALGLLLADLKRVFRETALTPANEGAAQKVISTYQRLRRMAESEFANYGCKPAQIRWEHALEMRYHGQGYEITVGVEPGKLQAGGVSYLLGAFADAHRIRYGATVPTANADIVTFQVTAEVATTADVLEQVASKLPREGLSSSRTESFSYGGRRVDCQFIHRQALTRDASFTGPCIVEEHSATTFVPPGWNLGVDDTGSLILKQAGFQK